MSIRAAPEPKLAMTTGAYTLASRAPNWLRRAGVATTRSDPSGSLADVPSTSSRPAPTPLACSAAHMAGSQATIASGLTCAAIHRAAEVLVAVAACSEAEICEPEFAWLDGRADDVVVVELPMASAAMAAETASTAQATSASSRQPVTFRPATGCRCSHSRTVVAMTVGHEGSGAGRRTPARGHVPLSAIFAPHPCHQARCGYGVIRAHLVTTFQAIRDLGRWKSAEMLAEMSLAGSDSGSPNRGSTLLSKRVMAQTRSPARAMTMRPTPGRVPSGAAGARR